MTWKKIRIGDFGKIVTGNTPPKNNPEFYGKEYKFIKPTDMEIDIRYTNVTDEYYSNLAYEKYASSLIPPLSSCVVTIGTIGKKMTLSNDYCFVNQAVNAVIPSEQYDPFFVFYALKNILSRVKSADTGASSGRENVSKSNFSNLTLEVSTDLIVQQKIASILSSYDDLIENNLKRIKLLEEAAQNIYKEWFVNFRFPGYEDAEFENGLPSGWKKKPINKVAFINEDSITLMNKPEFIHYVDIASTGTGFFDAPNKLQFSEAPSRARRILKNGDTIFSSVRPNRKTFALIIDPIENLVSSTGFMVITPRDAQEYPFIYLSVSNQNFVDRVSMVATGSAYPAVNQKDFEQTEIIMPPSEVISQLYKLADPIYLLKHNLIKQNHKLKEAREILLPRLMNQTIEVS